MPASEPRSGRPDGKLQRFPRARFEEFIANFKIQSKDEGLTPLRLLSSQTYILDEIEAGLAEGISTFYILKARQLGASTIFLALDTFWMFEHPGLLASVVTHEEQARDLFRSQISLYLTTLPLRYRVNAETHNRLMLILENASQARYLVAGTKTSTNKLGRSGGCNYLHASEVAFYGSEDDIASLNNTLSELYPHRLYIYETTANGFNHFEEAWRAATSSPACRCIFVGWWRDERNEFSDAHPLYEKYMPQGRRSPLTKIERERIQEVKKAYGVEITAGQIAWYRYHLENKCNGDQAMMDQEQPWTADDAFQATGSKFFSAESLTRQIRKAKEHNCLPFVFKLTKRWEEIQVARSGLNMCELKIWERPSHWGKYVIGCDPAYGSGPEADRSVITVFRCYADRTVQVAEFASPASATYQTAWVLAYLAGLYRDVMVILEITGPGQAVLAEVQKLQAHTAEMSAAENPDMRNCLAHMRHFLYRRIDSTGGGVVRQWRGTTELKDMLFSRFRDGIELERVEMRSLHALDEMRNVHRDGDIIEGAGGRKDDRAVANALAYYAWSEWRQPELKAAGMSFAQAMKIEQQGGEDPLDGLVRKFMAVKGIAVKDRVE